jgi:prepilin-type N-terminal cleavage/methylation domain-containing protein
MRIKKARRGFSLIELLVVVAIIAILIALSAAAIMRFRLTGLTSATKTNLGKIQLKLRDKFKAVTDKARNDSFGTPANQPYAALARTVAPGAGDSEESIRNAYVLLRQIQAFPTNFSEAFWPNNPGSPQATAPYAWPAYVTYLNNLGIKPGNQSSWSAIPLEMQAAICALMILEVGPGGGSATTAADDVATATGNITLPGGFPVARGIVDSWKVPVNFQRIKSGTTVTLQLVSAGADNKFGTIDDIVVNNPNP